MIDYTIYCSEEQTRKALELGAPIEMDSHSNGMPYIQDKTNFFISPTVEQMIGWFQREKGIYIWVEPLHVWKIPNDWYYAPKILIENCDYTNRNYTDMIPMGEKFKTHKTIKDAYLSAIDRALDYLINKK